WGEVAQRLAPHGWIVPAAPTTSSATIGGSLGTCSLSRFSPLFGKEGKAVVSVDVVTPDGTLHTCRRDEDPALFYAAIGGFGGVGAIVSATYAAHRVPLPMRVRTFVRRHPTFTGLERLLGPAGLRGERTVYSVLTFGEDQVRGLVLASEYCGTEE